MSDNGYMPQALAARTRTAMRSRGAGHVTTELARWAGRAATGLPWTLTGGRGEFVLQGRSYRYLYHRYKFSWLTERAVEIPVVQALVDWHTGGRILEVGNVLSHYRPQSHLIVDKYEAGPGVLNQDVLELDGQGPFDLIVAISTLEHVGFDELPRDPAKAVRAVAVLRDLLAEDGLLVVTVPLGYNPSFDAALRDGTIPVAATAALRRPGAATCWREVPPEHAWSVPYDFLLYRANAVLFAFIRREPG